MTHDEFHNFKIAYIAGALDDGERAAFESHAAACPACAAALEQDQAADRELGELFASAQPDRAFEDRIIARVRTAPRPSLVVHPMIRRAAVGVAAAILLGGAGFVVTRDDSRKYVINQTAANTYDEVSTNPAPGIQSPRNFADQLGRAIEGKPNPKWYYEFPASESQAGESVARNKASDPKLLQRAGADWDVKANVSLPAMKESESGGVAGARAAGAEWKDSPNLVANGMLDADGDTTAGTRRDTVGKSVTVESSKPVDQSDAFMSATDDRSGVAQAGRSFRPGDVTRFGRASGIGPVNANGKGDGKSGDGAAVAGVPIQAVPGQQQGQQGQQASGATRSLSDGKTALGRESIVLGQEVTLYKGRPNVVATAAGGQAEAPPAQPQQPVPPPQPAPANVAERKIIRNGEMTFEIDGYDSAVVQIGKIAGEEGGFIATTESEKLPNGKVKGSVVVRVPPERLDTLVLKLRGLGDLKSSRIAAQDITKQYTDLDAQLRAAKTMEERLLEIIKGGKGEVKDLIEAEKQLGSWREKIEKLEGEIRYYNNLVSLSTLTVTLAERDVKAAALLSESEQVDMAVEAADVEKARAEAIKAIEEAKGRIVQSDLKKHDAGQFAATIVADVSPDAAGPVTDRLKQLGRVARLEVQRRQATAEGAGPPAPGARLERKDTRLQISVYNLANVAARSTTELQLATDDVEKAYRAIVSQVESAGGRVVNSQLATPTPEQTTGTVSFEVPVASADVLLDAVRGAGEVVRVQTTTNLDTQNTTDAKRGFSVQVRTVASMPAKESASLSLAADDVPAKYDKLLDGLREAGARVVDAQIDQSDPTKTTATITVDARRPQREAIDKALAEAGGVYGRTVARSSDGGAMEDKIRLTIAMRDIDNLAPRETTTLGVETTDVTKAAAEVEATAVLLGGRKVDSDWAQQPGGQTIARVVVDVPLAKSAELIAKTRGQGRVLTVQREQNPGSPDGSFARARLSVTLATADSIVAGDQGFGSSVRSGLATSVQWLLKSVTWVVIGLCLVGPWALIVWGAMKVVRRRRAKTIDSAAPATMA